MRTLAGGVALALLAACATSELPAPAPVDPGCERVASLAESGEHKPAVDEMAALGSEGVSCPEPVVAAAKESRVKLEEANAYLHQAQARRRQGDLAGARQDFRRALEVYPKYYWAEKLQRDLEETVAAELAGLSDRAARLSSDGDLQGALELLEGASSLADSDARLEAELEILRRQIAERSLALARRAEQQGNLAEAERRTAQSLTARPTDGDLRRDLVEYARLLGLKLFSAGELTRAQELWSRALSLDEANEKLREYLREVQDRLRSLEKIKTEDHPRR